MYVSFVKLYGYPARLILLESCGVRFCPPLVDASSDFISPPTFSQNSLINYRAPSEDNYLSDGLTVGRGNFTNNVTKDYLTDPTTTIGGTGIFVQQGQLTFSGNHLVINSTENINRLTSNYGIGLRTSEAVNTSATINVTSADIVNGISDQSQGSYGICISENGKGDLTLNLKGENLNVKDFSIGVATDPAARRKDNQTILIKDANDVSITYDPDIKSPGKYAIYNHTPTNPKVTSDIEINAKGTINISGYKDAVFTQGNSSTKLFAKNINIQGVNKDKGIALSGGTDTGSTDSDKHLTHLEAENIHIKDFGIGIQSSFGLIGPGAHYELIANESLVISADQVINNDGMSADVTLKGSKVSLNSKQTAIVAKNASQTIVEADDLNIKGDVSIEKDSKGVNNQPAYISLEGYQIAKIEGNLTISNKRGIIDLYLSGSAGNESIFQGLTKVEDSSTEAEINLSFVKGAKWILPDNNDLQGTLTLDDGVVDFVTASQNPVKKLTVDSLTGNNGMLRMRTDGVRFDQFVAKNANGSHGIMVESIGVEPSTGALDTFLVQTQNGDASFSLANPGAKVDLGVYNYTLADRETDQGHEWFLNRSQDVDPDLSPTAEAVVAMAGMGAQNALYLNQLSDLRQRLGEVRHSVADGLWASATGQKDRIDGFSSTSFKQEAYRFNFGVDRRVSEDWLIGANIKLTTADQKTYHGQYKANGDAHSEGLNLYATWLHDNGTYADFVFSADLYDQEISTHMLNGQGVDGEYRNYGLGISAEVGRKFLLDEEKKWFMEPQAQLSYYWLKGDDFVMSNSMTVEQYNFDSLNSRLGVVVGRDFFNSQGNMCGQIALRAGVQHEFLGDQGVEINDIRFEDDLLGTRFYYGIEADWSPREDLKLYGFIEREEGSHYTKEFELSVGLKYSF